MPHLYEKAVLVKLTSHRPTLLYRDPAKTEQLQQVTGDTATAAYVRLFKSRTPVTQVISLHGEVGRLHQRLTLPYEDRHARLLANVNYLTYSQRMRSAMDAVAEWFDQHRAKYPAYVAADCAERFQGNRDKEQERLKEYPSVETFEAALSHDLEFMPMPQLTHFLFDLTDEDRQAFEARQVSVVERAVTDALDRVRKPLDHLLARLSTYAKGPGQKFHTTLLTNVTDGISDMDQLLLQDVPPALRSQLDTLAATLTHLATDMDLLRDNAQIRTVLAGQVTQTIDSVLLANKEITHAATA